MSTTRLADFVIKKSVRAESIPGFEEMEVYGVSNKLGITVTDHKKSKDLAKYLLIEEGDFAYNPYRINVGSIGLVSVGKKGLVSPAYVVFKTNDNLIPELLLDFLKSQEGLRQIGKYARGTVRKSLRFEDLAQIELPVPTKGKQKEILAKRKSIEVEVDSVKTELTHQQTLLKKLRQQILQEAIEGKLTADWRAKNPDVEPASELLKRIAAEKAQLVKNKKIKAQKPLPPITDEEKPFELPQGWEWSRLGQVFNFIDYRGKTPRKLSSGVRLITARNVKFGTLSLEPEDFISKEEYDERMTRGFPKFGDLLFTTEAPLGNVCLLTIENENISTGQRLITLQSYQKDNSNKLFMLFMLSPFYQGYFLKNATGVTAKGIKAARLRELVIPVPSSEEQKVIVSKVEKLLGLCNQLETQITQNQSHAEQLTQAVLKEAFSHNSEPGPAAKKTKASAHTTESASA